MIDGKTFILKKLKRSAFEFEQKMPFFIKMK